MITILKTIRNITLLCIVGLILFLGGCDLIPQNQNQSSNAVVYGRDLVINEVFTISPSKYYAYSWLEIMNPTNHRIDWFNQVFPAIGSAVGAGGAVAQTSNDGAQWFDTLGSGALGKLTSINYPNTDTGWICGYNGVVYKIHKHGLIPLRNNLPAASGTINYKNLNYYSISGAYRYVDIQQIDIQNRNAIMVGDSGVILRSLDHGNTWARVPSAGLPASLHKRLNYVYSNFLNLMVVGEAGIILQSTNAGTNWASKILPEPYRTTEFFSCWTLDTLAWATGDGGAILESTNGGNVWTAQNSHVSVSLRSCFFGKPPGRFPAGLGWVAGDNGTILRTENNGGTWTKVSSGTTARLNAIWFVDSLRGWACGNGGVLISSIDGGVTWQPQASGTSSDLLCVDYVPLLVSEQNYYALTMYAQISHIFYDPVTGVLNPDFIVGRPDTGIVAYAPQSNISVPLRSFVLVKNNTQRFNDHFTTVPGNPVSVDFPLAIDTTGQSQPGYNTLAHLVKWNLLPYGEVRLLKVFIRFSGQTPVGTFAQTVDVVRWGGYRPKPDDYPNNVPAPAIPENWSLARYKNDPGENPSVESTAYSFYLTDKPIPGWFSQLAR